MTSIAPLSLLLSALIAGSALAAAPAPTAAAPATTPAIAGPDQALAALKAAGHAEVRELEYDDGLWEAEVRRANGRWGEVAVDAATGEVFDAMSPRQLIELRDVLAAIETAGYTRVHDLDRDGALWDAEAWGADGQRYELRVSGYDGRILTARVDHDD